MQRLGGRSFDQMRSISITAGVCEYASGSVLIEIGKTKVLCNVTLQQGVPIFKRDKPGGWLTAEYSMIPSATQSRTMREATQQRRNSRSLEISRLIGRVFRTVVDLSAIGHKTIYIDCDVIQADGGTRTAALTGAWVALKYAQAHWLNTQEISKEILTEDVAAVSVGSKDDDVLLDLDFSEDCEIDSDFNFVLTRSGDILEIQGTAEKVPLSWVKFEQFKELASVGIEQIFHICDKYL